MKEPLNWEATMTPEEVGWCMFEIMRKIDEMDEPCTDNLRAARTWKSSQMRRFRKQENTGCCGSINWIAYRFNPFNLRRNWKHCGFDKYMLGFNYGH